MAFCWGLWICLLASAPPAIVFAVQDEPRRPAAVAMLPEEASADLSAGNVAESLGRRWLCLKLIDGSGQAGAPILADYARRGNELRLVPRYALAAGTLY